MADTHHPAYPPVVVKFMKDQAIKEGVRALERSAQQKAALMERRDSATFLPPRTPVSDTP